MLLGHADDKLPAPGGIRASPGSAGHKFPPTRTGAQCHGYDLYANRKLTTHM